MVDEKKARKNYCTRNEWKSFSIMLLNKLTLKKNTKKCLLQYENEYFFFFYMKRNKNAFLNNYYDGELKKKIFYIIKFVIKVGQS